MKQELLTCKEELRQEKSTLPPRSESWRRVSGSYDHSGGIVLRLVRPGSSSLSTRRLPTDPKQLASLSTSAGLSGRWLS